MIQKIKAYYFKDRNGIKLTLCYGREVSDLTGEIDNSPTDQRWVMYGKRIPMPVRSGTWFQGLSSVAMVNFLEANGYTLEASVNLSTGIMHKYVYDEIDMYDVEHHIRNAYRGDNKVALVMLYRDITGMSIHNANNAVNAIIDKAQY